MITKSLLALTAAALVAAGLPAYGADAVVFDFEDANSPLNEKWVPSALDAGTHEVSAVGPGPNGTGCLKITGALPQGFGVSHQPWRDWQGYTTLSFDLLVPDTVPDADEAFDCWVYVKDASYYWFETPIYADSRTLKRVRAVARGKWARYELDISQDSAIWRPGGHKRSWDHATRRPREFGLRFFGKQAWQGTVYLDNVKLSGRDEILGPIGSSGARRKSTAQWIDVIASARNVPKYEKLELTFQLAESYSNPFDPEVVDVQGHFVSPAGVSADVPGFYYQPYERSLTADGHEKLTPVGEPSWKIRFAPREIGEYTYWVSVRDAAGEMSSRPATFMAIDALHPEGYVRVSRRDPKYFEFDNGDWFWPVGINMRDGGDDAANQKGTYDFDHYFKRFHDEGLNFVRTWMCAWWAGIEWGDEYHSRFGDEGWYNLYNAWRLDYCVDLAAQYDLLLEITFNSHGQVRRDKFDQEWQYSPWNVRNGGYVASPAMFFSDERVKRAFRNRYRYIVARWGYSRNIMSWDLWNEVDLVEGYDPGLVAAWHQEMAGYLRKIDPWQHLIVTHICLFWSFGNEMWALPGIDYVQSDAYWDQKKDARTDMGMYASYQGKTDPNNGNEPTFNKPFVFIEYGPQTTSVVAGQVTPAVWRNRFRTGMWTSAVLPTAATPMFWYHKEWDQEQLYRYQRPVRDLFARYDRRGKQFRMRPALLANTEQLRVIGMDDGSTGFFYVHNPETMGAASRDEIAQPTQGARFMALRMPEGTYQVDFVDTLTLETTGSATAQVEPDRNRLQFDLPPVADDLLIRIQRQ